MKTFKCFILFLSVAATILLTAETANAMKDARQLSSEVLRLHVVAASDSSNDQELKLLVRDAVLEATAPLFEKAKNASEAAEIAKNSFSLIEETAKRVILENGYDYDVKISVTESYFPTKSYENDISLPAGVYNALKIEIGAADGQNWWCVLFPQICLSTSISDTSAKKDLLSPASKELAENKTSGARIKFKIIEIINGLFGR